MMSFEKPEVMIVNDWSGGSCCDCNLWFYFEPKGVQATTEYQCLLVGTNSFYFWNSHMKYVCNSWLVVVKIRADEYSSRRLAKSPPKKTHTHIVRCAFNTLFTVYAPIVSYLPHHASQIRNSTHYLSKVLQRMWCLRNYVKSGQFGSCFYCASQTNKMWIYWTNIIGLDFGFIFWTRTATITLFPINFILFCRL